VELENCRAQFSYFLKIKNSAGVRKMFVSSTAKIRWLEREYSSDEKLSY